MSAVERMPKTGEPPFHVDLTTNTLREDKHVAKLSPILASVIAAFLTKPAATVLSRDQIHRLVYGAHVKPVKTSTLRVTLSQANAKLRLFGWTIRSVHNHGYTLVPLQQLHFAPVDPRDHILVVIERDALRARVAELEAQIAAS